MLAAIDIGSNTLRMLLGRCGSTGIEPQRYLRQIARLSGRFDAEKGLHAESMQRAITVLRWFVQQAEEQQVARIRAVATEAVRRAANRQEFIDSVLSETGIEIEVIDGNREAALTTTGVMSVIEPPPERAIIMDIGGGSTELICLRDQSVAFQKSYPLGVVRLEEECHNDMERQSAIDAVFTDLRSQLEKAGLLGSDYCLVGTAGTVTTLAAMNLELADYQPALINNHIIPLAWMERTFEQILPLSKAEREAIVGMEPGRGDLIAHGLRISMAFCQSFQQDQIIVSDSGLLEGLLLEMCSTR